MAKFEISMRGCGNEWSGSIKARMEGEYQMRSDSEVEHCDCARDVVTELLARMYLDQSIRAAESVDNMKTLIELGEAFTVNSDSLLNRVSQLEVVNATQRTAK